MPRTFSRQTVFHDRESQASQGILICVLTMFRSSIAPQYIDAAYPQHAAGILAANSPRHDLLKFELSRISAQVLDHAMRVQTPPYASVTELHDKL